MFRFVNADFAAPGKGQASKFPPTLFAHVQDCHVLRFPLLAGSGNRAAVFQGCPCGKLNSSALAFLSAANQCECQPALLGVGRKA
jgi:hypothetical protein